jgi:hypothetical protein
MLSTLRSVGLLDLLAMYLPKLCSKCDKFMSPVQDHYTERVSITSKWHVQSESSYFHAILMIVTAKWAATLHRIERSWIQILARLPAVLTEDLVAFINSSEKIPREHVNVDHSTFLDLPRPSSYILENSLFAMILFSKGILSESLTASWNRPNSILFLSR